MISGITPSESIKRNIPRIRSGLKNGNILLALDCFEICGLVSGVLVEKQCQNGDTNGFDLNEKDFGEGKNWF